MGWIEMEKGKGFSRFSEILADINKLVNEAYLLSEARRLEERALSDDALELSEKRRITERDGAEDALGISEKRRVVERLQSDQALVISEQRRTKERDTSEKASSLNANRHGLEISLAQEEINKLDRQIIQVFESVREACLVLDYDYRLLYINPQAKRRYWPEADVAGKTINELFVEEDRAVFFRNWVGDRILGGQIHFRSDQFQKNKNVRISCYTAEYGYLVFFEDITESEELEREKLENLEVAEELVCGITEEICKPVTMVREFLQMIKTQNEFAEYGRQIELMVDELDRAHTAVTERLVLAKQKNAQKGKNRKIGTEGKLPSFTVKDEKTEE